MLADDRVRYVGEAIALVVAESRTAGLDALDLIACDFDELPVHMETAVGGAAIHAEAPSNLASTGPSATKPGWRRPSPPPRTCIRLELVNNRVMANTLEPRGCAAEWDGNRLHVAFSGQGVCALRDELADSLGLDQAAVRVATPGCRRRLRHEGLRLSRVFRGRLRGARARPPGALGGDPRRRLAERQRRAATS